MKHVVFMGSGFYPEVTHTAKGAELLSNFVHGICGCRNLWNSENIIDLRVEQFCVSKLAIKKFFLGSFRWCDSSVVVRFYAVKQLAIS